MVHKNNLDLLAMKSTSTRSGHTEGCVDSQKYTELCHVTVHELALHCMC